MVEIFITKEQANSAVEQAAIAGTSILIEKTTEAIEAFDSNIDESKGQKLVDLKTIGQQVAERKQQYIHRNYSNSEAYIKALNDILPNKIRTYPSLRQEFTDRFASTPISDMVYGNVQEVLKANKGNVDNPSPEIVLSPENWRLEVKATVTFESISDHKFIGRFIGKIPQKGYGPSLVYLKEVL